MRRDILGNATTISSPQAALAWDETTEAMLAHAKRTPEALAIVLAEDPHFAQAYAVKGLMVLTLARSEMTQFARQCLTQAEAAAHIQPPNARENSYIDALRHWLDGNIILAVDCLESIASLYPHDVMAIKLAHAIRFMIGDLKGMLHRIDQAAANFTDDTPFAGYIFGCRAFALEENGRYREAEATGRQAVALAPRDAWGLHAVAHVLEMNGRAEEGYAWLNGAAHYEHCNNFSYHIHWHRALFALELGRVSEVLALHDGAIRRDHTDDFRDVANGASILQRLELEGVDVGDRWSELADIASRRVTDGQLVFADLHYLLALLGGKRLDCANKLVATMLADARSGSCYNSRVAEQTGAHIAQGLVDFAAGRYQSAARHLMRGRDLRQIMGGSHAQRDVFEQVTLEALLRAGDLDRAEKILKARLSARSRNRFASTRLSRLQTARDQSARIGALLMEAVPAATHH